MNKKKIIIGVVILVVVAIIVYYLMSKKQVTIPADVSTWLSSTGPNFKAAFANGLKNGTISQSDMPYMSAIVQYWNGNGTFTSDLSNWWTAFSTKNSLGPAGQ